MYYVRDTPYELLPAGLIQEVSKIFINPQADSQPAQQWK